MKNLDYLKIVIVLLAFSISITSCNREFPNPNNPSEDDVLTTKDGLYALSIGMNQYYTTSVLRYIIETPGITTREFGVTNTFLRPIELARGGNELSGDSYATYYPFVGLARAKGMAESILNSVDNVDLSDEARASLIAYASLYKAMTLGHLILMYEKAPIHNSIDGEAVYSDRAAVLDECISLLETGKNELTTHSVSSDFVSKVLGSEIDLLASINAFLSRYNLIAGNYAEAISSADAALSSTSVFAYDASNVNPIWSSTVNTDNLDAQSNFGLIGAYIPEAGDGRVDFYLGADSGNAIAETGSQPTSELLGFFATSTSSIPVYLPGEMMLIKAEAYARQGTPADLANAVIQLDLVRTKTDDAFGVNAGLTDWVTSGGDANSQADILEEIYKNRCIEMFMTGMRLEDSRRFHPDLLTAPNPPNTTNERNRNFYPYPTVERENNPNIPDDPAL